MREINDFFTLRDNLWRELKYEGEFQSNVGVYFFYWYVYIPSLICWITHYLYVYVYNFKCKIYRNCHFLTLFLFTDSEQSPGVYLRDDPLFGTQLQNHSELRVPTAEKAAFYLDAAMDSRMQGARTSDNRDSHLLFTLHVYQYSVAGKGGGNYIILV